jgi:hypothetical protein
MSTGMKVVLFGCLGIVVVGVIALGVGGWFVKSWVTEKAEDIEKVGKNIAGSEDSEYGQRIAKVNEQYPFHRPEDNVITEGQLQRFLAARKSIHQVYKKYENEIKQLDQSSKENPLAALKGFGFLNDLRLAQAGALESQRMSKDEYEYLVSSVYSTWLTSEAKEALGGKTVVEFTNEQLQKSMDQLDQQLQNPNLPEDTRKQLLEMKEKTQKQMNEVLQDEGAKRADEAMASIPPQNIELFKKYEAEIKQYGMSGLEFIGL